MRRLLGVLTSVLLVLAAALCVTTLCVWARSYWLIDEARYSPRGGVHFSAVTRPGLLVASRTSLVGRTSDMFSDGLEFGPGRSFTTRPRPPGPAVSPFTDEGSPRAVQWFGLDYLARDQSRPVWGAVSFRRVVVPLWLVTLVSGLPPLIAVARRIRRARRRPRGLCPDCGYDLRATPGRCPECGAVPKARVTRHAIYAFFFFPLK